jgi:hypothetical protein
MRSWLSIAFVGVSGLALVACSGSGSDVSRGGGGSGGAVLDCSTLEPRPDDCGKDCSSSRECEASFCDNGKCAAQCTATQGCDSNSTCNVSGHCVPNVGTGGTGGTGNTGGGNSCQSVTITPTRSIPNVMFLVDQSGSMRDPVCSPGGVGTCPNNPPDRWEAAHGAITTIVQELQSIVGFGLTTYHSNGGGSVPAQCPVLETEVAIAMDNFSSIDSNYESSFPGGGDTPTGESIDAVVDAIQGASLPGDGPTILVLATDGEPDTCAVPNPQEGQPEAVAAATNACAAQNGACTGIQTYILSVGDDVGQDHLQDMANVGIGLAEDGSEGNAEFWVGLNPNQLTIAFRDIISASISCDIQMDEQFANTMQACNEGDVRLDGVALPCSQTDGWRVKPEVNDVIELVGSACVTLRSGDVTFSATFPCGAIVVE